MNRSSIPASLTVAAILMTSAFLHTSSAFLMWKAEKNNTVIHVLAKIDVIAPDADALITPAVTKAFDESDVIVFEFQMDPEQRRQDQRLIVQSAMYPAGDNLMRHIPRELAAEFNAICEQHQINNSGIVRVMPWAAGYKINTLAAKKAGVADADFIDHYFFKRAGGSGKAADYLTKPEEAIALFKNTPTDVQIDMFKRLLNEAKRKKESIKEAAAAWISGDAAAAEARVNESFEPYGALRETVSSRFSANWAAKLNDMTKYDEKIMAIVPLGNVVGSGNILDQLTAEGFTVTQVSAD